MKLTIITLSVIAGLAAINLYRAMKPRVTRPTKADQAFTLGCRIGYIIAVTGGTKEDVNIAAAGGYAAADTWLQVYLAKKGAQ